jgi:hypothetical protein
MRKESDICNVQLPDQRMPYGLMNDIARNDERFLVLKPFLLSYAVHGFIISETAAICKY